MSTLTTEQIDAAIPNVATDESTYEPGQPRRDGMNAALKALRTDVVALEDGLDALDTEQTAQGLAVVQAQQNISALALGKAEANHAHGVVVSGGAAGFMSGSDKGKLDGVAANATANTGTVTSVGMSVPTGLSVAGGPVTGAGTLAITLAAGYSIPTTAKQTEWDGKAAGAHVGAGGAAHPNAVAGGAAGFMTGADKAKLDNVAAGATANASDSSLRDRSTHTGTQAISTVTGLELALGDKLSASTAVPVQAKATPMVSSDTVLGTTAVAIGTVGQPGYVPAGGVVTYTPAQLATAVGATADRLAAVDAEIAEIALGKKLVRAKTTASHYVFGAYATMLEEMRKLCPGFGSSAPDTQLQGGIVTTSEYWYDPVNGNDANSGATLALAKRTIPNPLYTGSGRKTLLPSGLTLIAQSIQSGQPNAVISVWDSLVGSSTYGQEITWHPNPFMRALMGGWVTAAEKARWYVTLDGQIPLDSTSTLSGFAASHATTPMSNCIRGLVIRNYGYAAARANLNTTFRVEDCVIEDCRRTPTAGNGYYGGNGLRIEGATSKFDMARCFFERIGVDVVWCQPDSFDHKFADIAVKHLCEDQLYGSLHSDIFQFGGGYPGAFVLRRAVLHLQNREGPLLNSGNGEIHSGGAIMIASNAGTVRTGGLIEDVVMLSSYQHTYFHDQAGVVHRRVIALNYGRGAANPGTTGFAVKTLANNFEDCVVASYNTTFPAFGPYPEAFANTSRLMNLGRLDA